MNLIGNSISYSNWIKDCKLTF